jgi:hypothetical protein
MGDRVDSHPRPPGSGAPQPLHRRGILVAVAAFVAGGLASARAEPVQAGTDGDPVLNVVNTGSTRTTTGPAARPRGRAVVP